MSTPKANRSKAEIDDQKVEKVFENIRRSINEGMRLDAPQMRGLVERLRVDLMLSQYSRRKKGVYRALVDLLEDELENKADDSQDLSNQAVQYIKRLIGGLDD
ncbi:MAG: hypothetical protein RIM84_07095 [Alphaproteobacteria bacterium]